MRLEYYQGSAGKPSDKAPFSGDCSGPARPSPCSPAQVRPERRPPRCQDPRAVRGAGRQRRRSGLRGTGRARGLQPARGDCKARPARRGTEGPRAGLQVAARRQENTHPPARLRHPDHGPTPTPRHLLGAGAADPPRAVIDVAADHRAAHVQPQHEACVRSRRARLRAPLLRGGGQPRHPDRQPPPQPPGQRASYKYQHLRDPARPERPPPGPPPPCSRGRPRPAAGPAPTP